MGRKVFISSDMSVDEKITELARRNARAALMWPWFITAFDDWGRAEAHPDRLKAKVFPTQSVRPNEIQNALELYAEVGLANLYEVEGKSYIRIPEDTWFKWQTHIPKSRRDEGKSRIPAPFSEDARISADISEDARISADISGNEQESAKVALSLSPPLSHSPTPSPTPPKAGEWIQNGRGFVRRLLAISEKPNQDEAESVVQHVLRFVSKEIVDEALGFLEQADEPTKLPRRLVSSVQHRGEQLGIHVPEWRRRKGGS